MNPTQTKTPIAGDTSPLPAGAEDPLKPLIDDFLRDMEAARRSPHTIKNYRSDLGRFRKFVAGEGAGYPADPILPGHPAKPGARDAGQAPIRVEILL